MALLSVGIVRGMNNAAHRRWLNRFAHSLGPPQHTKVFVVFEMNTAVPYFDHQTGRLVNGWQNATCSASEAEGYFRDAFQGFELEMKETSERVEEFRPILKSADEVQRCWRAGKRTDCWNHVPLRRMKPYLTNRIGVSWLQHLKSLRAMEMLQADEALHSGQRGRYRWVVRSRVDLGDLAVTAPFSSWFGDAKQQLFKLARAGSVSLHASKKYAAAAAATAQRDAAAAATPNANSSSSLLRELVTDSSNSSSNRNEEEEGEEDGEEDDNNGGWVLLDNDFLWVAGRASAQKMGR